MHKVILSLLTALSLSAQTKVGDSFIPFSLPNLYNMEQTISDSKYQGKVILVNLWASWCNGCKEEMPLFVALQKKFPKNKFIILLSNIDSDPKNARIFLSKVDTQHTLTCLYDSNKNLPKAYQAIGMPSSYLIDKNGKVSQVFVGSINQEKMQELETHIHALIEQ